MSPRRSLAIAALVCFAPLPIASACASSTDAPSIPTVSSTVTTPVASTTDETATPDNGQPALRTLEAEINGYSVTLEIADDPEERSRGLSNRPFVQENGGMLLVWDEQEVRTLWMKQMRVALDFVWLDADRRVVHVEQDVQPQPGAEDSELVRYPSQQPAMYAVELEAGSVSQHNIRVGDIVEFDDRIITGSSP